MPPQAYNESTEPTRAVGYIRVSTSEQGQSGLGLAAQRSAIEAACAARGWQLAAIEQDIGSGAKADRPGLQRALAAVEAGQVGCIIVAKLDRLSRSVSNFAQMLERFPGGIVCLDVGVDASTPTGQMVATVVSAMAQLERRLIGQRTKDALAIRRAQGVRLGRPVEVSAIAIRRAHELQSEGLSVAAIARRLNEEQVATPRSGRWHSPGVKRLLGYSDQ